MAEKENNSIFRKASIERVNSPEQLNEYIRVVSPSIWIIIATVIIFLLGIVSWGVFGHVTTTVKAGAIYESGKIECIVPAEKINQIKSGMAVEIEHDGQKVEGTVTAIANAPTKLDGKSDSYSAALFFSGYNSEDFFYTVDVDAEELPDGAYDASIIIEDIKPISFITD